MNGEPTLADRVRQIADEAGIKLYPWQEEMIDRIDQAHDTGRILTFMPAKRGGRTTMKRLYAQALLDEMRDTPKPKA